MTNKTPISKSNFSLSLNSPLTLAMTSALLLSAASNQLSAAPCSPVASTITVTSSLGDASAGTLISAMSSANESSDCNQIEFASNVTAISLSASISPSYDVNIVGFGDHLPNISRSGYTALNNTGSNLFVENITISSSTTGIRMGNGGKTLDIDDVIFEENSTAIFLISSATTTVSNSTFDSNSTGVYAYFNGSNPSTTISDSIFEYHSNTAVNFSLKNTGSSLTIVDSIFQNNTINTNKGSGLDVWVNAVSSNISISGSVFDNNTTESGGDAAVSIGVNFGSLELDINNTSFTNNTGSGAGAGALTVNSYNFNTDITIKQSTFSGNSGAYGGAIRINNDSETSEHSLNIISSTIFDNSAEINFGGVAIVNTGGTPEVNISHSVIANNVDNGTDDPNLYIDNGSINSLSYSWIGASDLTFTTAPGEDSTLNGTNEGDILLALADNGGLGLTHMPSEGSPLIDAGDPSIEDEPETDQNGLARIVNDVIDIGAVEVQAPVEEEEEDDTNIIKKKKSSSGAIQWLLFPLALLGLRRKKFHK